MAFPRKLLIAVSVSAALRVPLRRAADEAYRLIEAEDWLDLQDIVRRRPVDAIIIDPAAHGHEHGHEHGHTPAPALSRGPSMTDVLDAFPRTPIVIYTSLDTQSARGVVNLVHHGIVDVLLHPFDDGAVRLHEVVAQAMLRRRDAYIPSPLRRAMEGLPPNIVRAFQQAFDRPQAFLSIADVAATAQINPTTLYRSLRRTPIQSPRRVLIAAKLLRGHRYMKEPAYSVGEIATKIGYRDARMFARHTRLALGVKPRQLRVRMSDYAVVDRLAEWMCRPE